MDFLAGLNPQQRAAAAHVEGPLLILAGAGSGKTRVITHRMAHLVDHHRVPGYAVLAVTFTNKAAGEMKERVHQLLSSTGRAHDTPFVSTFHSFCVRLLRRDGDRLAPLRPNFDRQFVIYDDDDQLTLIKQIFKSLGLDDKFMPYRNALSRISSAKSQHERPEDFYKNARDPKSSKMAVIYEQYEARMLQAKAVDFDDLLLETVRLLKHDGALRETYNRRFGFVMVDEYQDTNRSQYELMRLLSQGHQNVVAVGDEDQSIYSWRGADIRNILDFERDYDNARIIRLEQNYRSTKNIIEAASAVVANNTQRKGKNLWTDQSAGPKIGLYEALDGENEAIWIADRIEKVIDRDPKAQIAILYRTNFQSRQIEEALRRYGRRYSVIGGLSFYQRAEIKDALSYLKLIANLEDSISLSRIINTPARGIGKTTLDQVEQFANAQRLSLWKASGQLVETHALGARAEAAIAAFRRMIEELGEKSQRENVHELLSEVLQRSGYIKMLEENPVAENEGRLENLKELLNAAAEAAERGESVSDFLDHAALVSDADQIEEKSQISLLTIHNAKGLEFPVVFLAGMEEGLFPHSRSLENDAQMEEERRLCYVGMTRARQHLFCSWARARRRFGGGIPEPAFNSRFIAEIPEEFTERLSRGAGIVSRQVNLRGEQWEVRNTVNKYNYSSRPSASADNISSFFTRGNSSSAARPVIPKPSAVPSGSVTPSPPGTPSASQRTPAATTAAAHASLSPPAPPAARTLVSSPSPAPTTRNLFGDEDEMPPWVTGEALVLPASEPAGTKAAPAAPAQIPPRPKVSKPAAARPLAAPKKVSSPAIRAGSSVVHPRYGRGTVLRREGEGDDAKLYVQFPGYGLKKLVEKFAGVRPAD
jgi:DNA helicase-2/ATP-dependent DNA helicase PcrA